MENLMNGLGATIIGMLVVFATLLILSFILDSFKLLNKEKEEPIKEKEEQPIETIVEEETIDELELIAVITASIAASLGTSADKLRVTSFRRVNSKKSTWSQKNKLDQIRNY